MGIEELILIVPSERESISKAYFSDEFLERVDSNIKWGDIEFKRPDGKVEKVKGARVSRLDFLKEVTSEKLYLMVTNNCNVSCEDCGAKATIPTDGNISYIWLSFVEALLPYIRRRVYHYVRGGRQIFISGGEPTLDVSRLGQIARILAEVEKSYLAIHTNGIRIPIKDKEFAEFADRFEDVIFLVGYSMALKEQYAIKCTDRGFDPEHNYLPDCDPEVALLEKHRLLFELAQRAEGKVTVRPLIRSHKIEFNRLKEELFKHVGRDYSNLTRPEETQKLGRSNKGIPAKVDPCSTRSELTITPDGRVYSECYNYYAGAGLIGYIGTRLS